MEPVSKSPVLNAFDETVKIVLVQWDLESQSHSIVWMHALRPGNAQEFRAAAVFADGKSLYNRCTHTLQYHGCRTFMRRNKFTMRWLTVFVQIRANAKSDKLFTRFLSQVSSSDVTDLELDSALRRIVESCPISTRWLVAAMDISKSVWKNVCFISTTAFIWQQYSILTAMLISSFLENNDPLRST